MEYQYREETREERKRRIQKEKKRLKRMVRIIAVFVIILAVLVVALLALLVKSRLSTGSVGTTSSDAFSFTYVGEATEASADGSGGGGGAPETIAKPIPEISGDGIRSDYAFMLRTSDGATVFDKGGSDQIYPASMTKIMTVYVALESGLDLRTQITVTQAEIDPGYIAGAALAGFVAGEEVTAEELMYGALLPSGAEACLALADYVAGGEEEFVEMMNQTAQELGMENTHFSNCTGLHADDHYSTCSDIAIVMRAALQKNNFRRIISSKDHTTEPTAQHPDGLSMKSTMFEVLVNNVLSNGVVIQGGKTGTTDQALNCLASYATSGSETYILVTAHAADTAETNHPNISDAVTLYEQLPSAGT